MSPKSVVIVFVAAFVAIVCGEGNFMIVGSKYIRPNSDYHVAVTVHNTSTPTTMTVGVSSNKDYLNEQEVTVEPDSTKLVMIQMKDLPDAEYKLFANGTSGIIFDNATDLELVKKSFSLFIQTDKAIYKPGDLIHYRVLILDPNMKPAPIEGDVNIYLNDAKANRIKQWLGAEFTKGVYTNEFQLSSDPVLGDWQFEISVMNKTEKKTIEVAEYVLPKFEVTIDSNKHITFKDGKVRATIRAKYTYGKGVNGQVTVSVFPSFSGSIQPFSNIIVRKTLPIDGKAAIEFDIVDELKMVEDYDREISIEAIVEEELTTRKQQGKTFVNLHKYPYKIEVANKPKNFKQGLPLYFTLKVVDHHGAPVRDPKSPIIMRYSQTYNFNNPTEEEYKLDDNAMVDVKLTPPESVKSIVVEANYDDIKEFVGSFSVDKTRDGWGSAVQIKVLTDVPTINKEVDVEVRSNLPMSSFTYQILGRGDIIVSNTVEVPQSKIHVFKFLGTFAMVPKAQLVVYYIADNRIISDKVDIDFGDDLQNFVRLEMSTQQARPGDEIDLTITTKPNSYVGIMGVDQSVLLLKSGNDLSKGDVFKELEKYTEADGSQYRFRGYYGTDESIADFDSANAVVLSNTKREIRAVDRDQTTLSPFDQGLNNGTGLTTIKKTDIGPAHHLKTNTRPPLAGPFAFSRLPKPVWDYPRVDILHETQKTWLFVNFSSGFEGRTTIHKKVPDTITSWIITGFSVDPITGLGLTKTPRKLEVFQPFFLSLNLPYSIKRGETVSIPIVVFNYMDEETVAEVTLDNTSQEFEFTEVSNEVDEAPNPKLELYRRKKVTVPANGGAAVSFMVIPKKAGHVTIKASAKSSNAADAVERVLPVKPEGSTIFENKAVFVDFGDKPEHVSNFTVDIPKNAVPDSTRIEVSVVGDIFGPTLKNLDDLIRMPSGCGEQNMLNFVPNIVAINYLKSSGQLTPAVESKAKKFMEAGYQGELKYKHADGSFSAFGESDSSGSTWLTAFVAKSFGQAKNHIEIDPEVISKSLQWLSAKQADNGSFPEVGNVIHKDMQGGSANGIALTAYVLTAFLENKGELTKYRSNVDKAMEYIARNIEGISDPYTLAIAAYAFQIAQHNSKDFILQTLDSKASSDEQTKWWHQPIPESETKNPWYSKPNSVNIEMTSYALLAFLEAGKVTSSVPILKWLVNQRNSKGGFQSTQDTVVGLQALATFAEKISSDKPNVQVAFNYGDGAEARINVNEANKLVLQSYELPTSVRDINVTASGTGSAVIQLSYKYNVNVTGAWPRFTVDPQVNKNSNPDFLHLTVCTNFVPAGGVNESNMAVMEVEFPSGFTADPDTLASLKSTKYVKRVETKEGDTIVVLYFDKLDADQICPTFDAFRTHKVANQKPVPVTVYDYYDNSRQSRQFYQGKSATLCDICEGEDCGNKCVPRAEQRASRSAAEASTESTAFATSSAGQVAVSVGMLFAAIAAFF